MHLLILGLIVLVGILVYYILTTSGGNGASSDAKKRGSDDVFSHRNVPDDLRKEDNVIFLPNADKSGNDGQKEASAAEHDNVTKLFDADDNGNSEA